MSAIIIHELTHPSQILQWEQCHGIDIAVKEKLLHGGRPEVDESCPHGYQYIMESCWHQDKDERPRFHEVLCLLPPHEVSFITEIRPRITRITMKIIY